jgi:hypothetical protein
LDDARLSFGGERDLSEKTDEQALALAVARHGEQETGNRGILGHT